MIKNCEKCLNWKNKICIKKEIKTSMNDYCLLWSLKKIEFKLYNITIQVKCENKVKAKYCAEKMIKGLESESIWFCRKINITEAFTTFDDIEKLEKNLIKNF